MRLLCLLRLHIPGRTREVQDGLWVREIRSCRGCGRVLRYRVHMRGVRREP